MTGGEIARGRAASGGGPGERILGGLLTGLFLCDARVDGVAEALGQSARHETRAPPVVRSNVPETSPRQVFGPDHQVNRSS